MPTVNGITTQYELLPAGRNPYYQPPPPSKTISNTATRKVSGPTIIDADTVILDHQASDWPAIEPNGEAQPSPSVQCKDGRREASNHSPFSWRLALKAYAYQMPGVTSILSTGLQVNLVA